MYRGMGLYMLRQGIDPEDEQAVIGHCQEADITLGYENGTQVVYLNGENVNAYIRTEEVGAVTSRISVLPAVRERITALVCICSYTVSTARFTPKQNPALAVTLISIGLSPQSLFSQSLNIFSITCSAVISELSIRTASWAWRRGLTSRCVSR